jgi:hypothetical protein
MRPGFVAMVGMPVPCSWEGCNQVPRVTSTAPAEMMTRRHVHEQQGCSAAGQLRALDAFVTLETDDNQVADAGSNALLDHLVRFPQSATLLLQTCCQAGPEASTEWFECSCRVAAAWVC